MNYLDVYFSRINHLGETTAERIKNGGMRSFNKWLAQSPHTVRNLSVERGIFFDGLILTSKDKEYQKIMFLNVANDIPLKIGDIMNWKLEDGSIEKWLLIQEEKKVNGTYRTFWIVRCNYLMKWIDGDGHLQQSWGYFVSSLSNKIQGNFRTWHSLITPQPNKYAELLIPRYPINRSTNFIVEDESWIVVEYDHTSVPGVMYLSLTENKINLIYDDTENNVADTDKLAKYNLSVPQDTQNFNIGDEIKPIFTLTKNGVPSNEEIEYISPDKSIIRIINGVPIAIGTGHVDLTIQLKNNPTIQQKISIEVNSQEAEFAAYIEGSDKIRLDRESKYILKANVDLDEHVIFSINTKLVEIIENGDNYCIIHANDKNELGQFTLTAIYKGKEYKKEIKIIPLW